MIRDTFSNELAAEGKKSRKMIERVPTDKFDFKPHEKSSSLRALAQHVANLPIWTNYTLLQDELDFAIPMERAKPVESTEELVAFFDKRLADAIAVVNATSDETFNSEWTMRMGPQIFFTRPKHEVMREFVLSHIIHHRGQLSVYLRLLDIPVPGVYGPTADER